MENRILGIDWGTSNRRAYLIDRDGNCHARHADNLGLLAVGGRFAEALDELRNTMEIPPQTPVLMSGMVGSANGWQEVPYVDSAVALSRLPECLVPVRGQRGCSIVPGYVCRKDGVDVMRGEETQLLGAIALGVSDGWVVLPGTHSKWVQLEGDGKAGAIRRLHTYMTGELFAMLGASGTLAPLMKEQGEDETAFEHGLADAREQRPLTRALFGVRARVVSGDMPASRARSYLSGLLIGTEFAAAKVQQAQQANGVTLIASAALSERYLIAATYYGMTARVLDPDRVYCAALAQFFDKVSTDVHAKI